MNTYRYMHRLGGIPGWSSLNLQFIDVMKIVDMNHRKRLFSLTDRNYPYTLKIEYYAPYVSQSSTAFPIGGGIYSVYTHSHNHNTQIISRRYATEKDLMDEVNAIHSKMV